MFRFDIGLCNYHKERGWHCNNWKLFSCDAMLQTNISEKLKCSWIPPVRLFTFETILCVLLDLALYLCKFKKSFLTGERLKLVRLRKIYKIILFIIHMMLTTCPCTTSANLCGQGGSRHMCTESWVYSIIKKYIYFVSMNCWCEIGIFLLLNFVDTFKRLIGSPVV